MQSRGLIQLPVQGPGKESDLQVLLQKGKYLPELLQFLTALWGCWRHSGASQTTVDTHVWATETVLQSTLTTMYMRSSTEGWDSHRLIGNFSVSLPTKVVQAPNFTNLPPIVSLSRHKTAGQEIPNSVALLSHFICVLATRNSASDSPTVAHTTWEMLSHCRGGDVLDGDQEDTNKAVGLVSYVGVLRQERTVPWLLDHV